MEEVSNNMNFPVLNQEEKAAMGSPMLPCPVRACLAGYPIVYGVCPSAPNGGPNLYSTHIHKMYIIYLKKKKKIIFFLSALALQYLSKISSCPVICQSFKDKTCS